MTRVLLTRAREDAEPLAALLAERGLESDIEPLLSFVPAGEGPIDLTGVQALAFTSATGARMLAARTADRALPVFAVGDATAAAARAAGFARVESAAGDVDDLVRLIRSALDPKSGAVFHGAARQVAGDLQGQLTAASFDVRREILYEAKAVEALSAAVREGLSSGRYGAVAFFSPRTAETFVRLAGGHEIVGPGCYAACLSQAVASKVESLPWAGVRIAERPTQQALVDLLATLKREREAQEPIVTTAGDGSATDESMSEEKEAPASPEIESDDQSQPALAVIAAFGGIRPMATKLDIPVSTVQGWRERAVIPASRHPQILEAALEHDIEVDPDVVAASAGTEPPDGEAVPSDTTDGAEPAAEAKEGEAEAEAPEQSDREPRDDDDKPGEPLPDALTEVAAAAAAQSQPTAPPARRGRGILTGFLLAVAIFVGGAAAAVVTRDQWMPLAGGGPDPAVTALTDQLAAVNGQLGELSASLTALETQAKEQAAAADQSAQVATLETTLAGLAERIAGLETGLQEAAAGEAPDTSAWEQRLGDLELKLEGLGTESDGSLEARLADLEARLEGLAVASGAAADLEPLLERLAALETGLAQLEQVAALSEAQADLAAQASAAAERLTALEQQAGEAQAKVEALERQAEDAAAPPPPQLDGAASARHVALMLAVNRLKDAVASTAPYEAQLASVGALFGDDAAAAAPLGALAQSAAAGAPTVEDLREAFPEVAREIVAESAGGESESWTAEVRRSLASIVTLRRTGAIEGESADAIVARAELEVGKGDIEAAAAQLKALTGANAVAAAQGWLTQAEARVQAERAVQSLTEMAIARIAGSGD